MLDFTYWVLSEISEKYFRRSPNKPVRHQQTCPVCGRRLVNTYLRDGKWKCRRCWEEGAGGDECA